MSRTLIVTCEHGGAQTPGGWRKLFARGREVLSTHRGYDIGALELARRLAKRLRAPLFYSQVTRLLVDLNRSPGHPRLFSEYSRGLEDEAREKLLATHYRPYRERVERELANRIRDGQRVLHLSVHSFTPVLNGEVRRADIGFLYDPRRDGERPFCDAWRASLKEHRGDLAVRRNYPYLGTADGLVTWLRKRFTARDYAGVELEVNQKWPLGNATAWRKLQQALADSLAEALRAD